MTGARFMLQRPQSSRPVAAPVPRRAPPTFLFGIGSAKSGTSWLYEYLRSHPNCYLRGHKELHYFDSLEHGRVLAEQEMLASQIASGEEKLAKMRGPERANAMASLLDKRDFLRVLQVCGRDRNAYYRYMMDGINKQKLVADITPDYVNLSAPMLAKLVGVANETRFLYIMRDPVERLWSHVRMNARFEESDFVGASRALLAKALSGEDVALAVHSDYAMTLTKMEKAIPAERRMAMFYEDLMTQEGLRKLCAFLGIKPTKAYFERKVLPGRAAEMTTEDRAAARRFLRPQYEAVASRFPVLPKAWQNSMAEGFA